MISILGYITLLVENKIQWHKFWAPTNWISLWVGDIIGNNLIAWNIHLTCITNIGLSQQDDEFHWNLHQDGVFSMKSHYLALIHSKVPNLIKCLWILKAQLKIKIFSWYLQRGVILTEDNLIKQNWKGSKQCSFCHKDVIMQHLFFECRTCSLSMGSDSCNFWNPKPLCLVTG